MAETKFTPQVIHVENERFVFEDYGKEIVLPRVGHTPGYRDKVSIATHDDETTYSFIDKKGATQATYTKKADGSCKVVFGEKEIDVSAETMKAIETGAKGIMKNGKLQSFTSYDCGQHRVKSIERPNRRKLYTTKPPRSAGR